MKLIPIALLGLLLAGCKNYLDEDPRGQVVGTAAINSVEGLDAALTGSYKGLTTTWITGFTTSAVQAMTMGSDDITTHPASNKQDFREADQFNVTSQNGRTAIIWNGCYKTILNTNNIVNNYQKVAGNSAKVDAIVGEAYFLRAFAYYWLVRGWGNIPLITTAEFSPDLLTVQKSAPADVYALIEADLLKAEQLVSNTKRNPGRPNKGSVKALLADVYLTEGGWPLRNTAKYALAASKAKEVMDNRATYGFDLYPDLTVLWSGSSAGAYTSEDVFSLATSETQWFSSNVMYGSAATPSEENGWDDYFAEITFYNNFPVGKRKDLTFYTTFQTASGISVPWQQGQTKHPYYRKFRLQTNNTSSSSLPVSMIRYAHVLLTYAEAQARSGALTTDAYTALNAVRNRAGLSAVSNLSAPDFATAVVNERSWEFAAEWTRWFDLVRLEQVETANANKATDDLKPLKTITKANYWMPIPAADVNQNPNLK